MIKIWSEFVVDMDMEMKTRVLRVAIATYRLCFFKYNAGM